MNDSNNATDVRTAEIYTESPVALLPGERLHRVEYVTVPNPIEPPSALRSLLRLADVRTLQNLGETGPVMGSLPDPSGSAHLNLFQALFGRDSLRVADILAVRHPRLAVATVLRLAELQGTSYTIYREEEPGRIPHEVRQPDDPIARTLSEKSGWQWPYYGSVDSTPMWIIAAARCLRENPRTAISQVKGLDGRNRSLASCFRLAVEWLYSRIVSSPSNLLESRPAFAGSIENQVWKDSWDAYAHADGTLARSGTVASVEAQALAYDALHDAADVYSLLPPPSTADAAPPTQQLIECAEAVRQAVLGKLWVDTPRGGGLGFFAMGADRGDDGGFRPLAVRSSNMGHLLDSRMLQGGDELTVYQRDATVRSLFAPELLCAAGIRTLATCEVRFRAGAYHNGSSWPWDTHVIARGLHRHGYRALAWELRRRVLALCNRHQMFPEFARGEAGPVAELNRRIVEVTDGERINRVEQPPQRVQAWTVAAVLDVKALCSQGWANQEKRALGAERDPRVMRVEEDIMRQVMDT